MRSAIVTTMATIVPVVALLAAAPGWAQEADTPAEETSVQPADEPVERSVDEDPVELDEASYADAEEEDFVPSEDIPTDQAIAFPTDI